MNEHAYRMRQVLDDHRRRLVEAARMIALGAAIINDSSDAAVLRSSDAAAVGQIRR